MSMKDIRSRTVLPSTAEGHRRFGSARLQPRHHTTKTHPILSGGLHSPTVEPVEEGHPPPFEEID